MSTIVDRLAEQVMQLSFAERADLAERILRSLEPPGEELTSEEWGAAWKPELERRIQAYERGESEALERNEAMATIREAFRQRRQS
jgi:putative addiction module component (TIGR02574 family)